MLCSSVYRIWHVGMRDVIDVVRAVGMIGRYAGGEATLLTYATSHSGGGVDVRR